MLKVLHGYDPQLDQLYEIFLPVLLKICERTNRVFIVRATDTIQHILTRSHSPMCRLVVPHLMECMSSASKSLRLATVKTASTWIAVNGHVEDVCNVEAILFKALEDAAGEIREASRELFRVYTERWSDRREAFCNMLSLAAQKVLNLAPAKKEMERKPIRAFLAPYATSKQIQVSESNKSGMHAPQRLVNPTASVAPSQPSSRPSSAVRIPVRPVELSEHTLPLRKLEFKPAAPQDSAPKRVLSQHAKPHTTEFKPELKRSSSLMKKSSSSSSTGSTSNSSVNADIEFVQILKNGLWSEKCEALELLPSKINKVDSRLEAAIMECLGDTHHRVLQSVVDATVVLLSLFSNASLEHILIKFVSIGLNPQFRAKAQLMQSCDNLREAFRKRMGAEDFVALLCGVQMRPDVAGNVKLRTMLTNYVAREILAFGGEMNTALVKLVASRMSIPISDHDEALAQAAKGVFAALKQTMPDTIYWGSIVPAVKSSSGRQRLRELEAVRPVARDGNSHIPVRSPPKSFATAFYPGQLVTPSKKIFAPVDEEISFKLRHTRLGSS